MAPFKVYSKEASPFRCFIKGQDLGSIQEREGSLQFTVNVCIEKLEKLETGLRTKVLGWDSL